MPTVKKIVREIPAPIPVTPPIKKISTRSEPEQIPKKIIPIIEEQIGTDETLKPISESAPETSESSKQGLLPLPIIEAKPLYRKNPPPDYPSIARRRRYQGTVVVEVLVNENGRVKNQKIFTSSGYKVLDTAALKSVKKWLFTPGTREGKPLAMWVRVPLRFLLK